MIDLIQKLPKRRLMTWVLLLAAIFLFACSVGPPANVFKRRASRLEFKRPAPQPRGKAEFRPPESRRGPRKPDVHFSARYCLECHLTRKVDPKTKSLKYNGDFNKLCLRCHDDRKPIHFHPMGVPPDSSSGVKIPAGFPLQQGKLDCRTCHDIYQQCHDSEADKLLLKGQMLLRGMPYKNPLVFCYRCHDQSNYLRYNPHQQLDAAGHVLQNKCLYCHTTVPDASRTTYREVKLIDNYTELCKGCHYSTARQPLHARHLRKPPLEIAQHMKEMQEEYKIVLPLDRQGRITCVTCHNPHQKGLIPDQRAGAAGAGAAHRQRLAGNLCIKCHPLR